jgi:hypothetical protein
MKKILLIGSLTLAVGFLAVGCSSIDKALYRPNVETLPLPPGPQFVTNEVSIPTFTNSVGTVIPGVTNTVVLPNIRIPERVTNGIAENPSIKSGISLVGMLPFPFAGTAAVALGWLYSAYAAVRNKKIAVGVVKSVEAARDFLQETPEGQKVDAKIVQILAAHQDSAGVVDSVKKLLNDYVH